MLDAAVRSTVRTPRRLVGRRRRMRRDDSGSAWWWDSRRRAARAVLRANWRWSYGGGSWVRFSSVTRRLTGWQLRAWRVRCAGPGTGFSWILTRWTGSRRGRTGSGRCARELRACDVVVFLNSRAGQESKWCHSELVLTAELGKPVQSLDLGAGPPAVPWAGGDGRGRCRGVLRPE